MEIHRNPTKPQENQIRGLSVYRYSLSSIVVVLLSQNCEVLYFWSWFAFVLLSFFVPFVLRHLCTQKEPKLECVLLRRMRLASECNIVIFPTEKKDTVQVNSLNHRSFKARYRRASFLYQVLP